MFIGLFSLFLLLNVSQIVGIHQANCQLSQSINFADFAAQSIPLRLADGKIDIPRHIKHVKLDIGLSYSAPISQYWLSHEDAHLMIFGFEPNPACVKSILQGATKLHPLHGDPLETKFIEKNFFLIPCALGLSNNTMIKFFVTKEDCGCSSIFAPKYLDVSDIIEVPIFKLSDFFDIFPFDTHPVIDYIKIDAQGADLAIAKSAGHYLAERVVYITLEAEDNYYHNTDNSFQAIDSYMRSIGFVPHVSNLTCDPTYFNPRFSDYVKTHTVKIYQNG